MKNDSCFIWTIAAIFTGIFVIWAIRAHSVDYLLILGVLICGAFGLKWIIETGVGNVHDSLTDMIKKGTREALDETHLKETIREAVQEALEHRTK